VLASTSLSVAALMQLLSILGLKLNGVWLFLTAPLIVLRMGCCFCTGIISLALAPDHGLGVCSFKHEISNASLKYFFCYTN